MLWETAQLVDLAWKQTQLSSQRWNRIEMATFLHLVSVLISSSPLLQYLFTTKRSTCTITPCIFLQQPHILDHSFQMIFGNYASAPNPGVEKWYKQACSLTHLPKQSSGIVNICIMCRKCRSRVLYYVCPSASYGTSPVVILPSLGRGKKVPEWSLLSAYVYVYPASALAPCTAAGGGIIIISVVGLESCSLCCGLWAGKRNEKERRRK